MTGRLLPSRHDCWACCHEMHSFVESQIYRLCFLVVESGVKKATPWQRFKVKAFRMKMLIWWTLAGVALGIILGAALYGAHPSKVAINLIGVCVGACFLQTLGSSTESIIS